MFHRTVAKLIRPENSLSSALNHLIHPRQEMLVMPWSFHLQGNRRKHRDISEILSLSVSTVE